MRGRTSAEMAKPLVRSDFGPCNRAACPAESHLSHGIPLIPFNPTYPTESQLSHSIPLNPDESRIRVSCSIPPPPVPLPPEGRRGDEVGNGLRSLFPLRGGEGARAAPLISPSPPRRGGEGRGEKGVLAHALLAVEAG